MLYSIVTGAACGIIGGEGVKNFYGKSYDKNKIFDNAAINSIHALFTLTLVNNALATNATVAARVGVGAVSLWFAAVPLTAVLLYQIGTLVGEDKKAVNGVSSLQKGLAWALVATSIASVAAAAIAGQWLFAGVYAFCVLNNLPTAAQRSERNNGANAPVRSTGGGSTGYVPLVATPR